MADRIAARLAELQAEGFQAWRDGAGQVAYEVPFTRLSDRRVMVDVWREKIPEPPLTLFHVPRRAA